MGDPSGIGPEIILKAIFSKHAKNAARMVVIGYPEPFVRDAGLLNLDIKIRKIDSPHEVTEEENTLHLIVPAKSIDIPLRYGILDKSCGHAAALCIELSAKLAMNGEIDAVVTAPINKESLNMAGYNYPGHTEFYQQLTGAENTAMMLTLGNFRVIHVVTHIPIRDVPDMIKKERIVKVATLMHDVLLRLGIKRPGLAVSGLNPHAGESGLFGKEELEEIIPAVDKLKEADIDVTGPLPPDTVFARAYNGEFDGVVAMFHDQGHIALKLAGFKFAEGSREIGGVNTTLGMPIIRTSVDHGTAFDIAGKGIASHLSMIEAVEMAAKLVRGNFH
ncbi:MAG TPA: 4-hydroxythreonine-4-phosphate dehydrogenase PdxA [bacterium]|nr:4-hydroxythreonine-4-phosphate dehydrogenase PdxA [bacterium]